MRTAYSGRAAAYEKQGEYEKALADYKMAVLFYAIEAEILNSLQTSDRAKFLSECAGAYRARGQCLDSLGRAAEAAMDRKRADGLDADAKKLASAEQPDRQSAAIQIINAWTEPVTLVVGGTIYRLAIGEQTKIIVTSATIAYEMQAGSHRTAGTFEAGRTYKIRPTP
jgi:tetratricopeptide (TPR) repeat protein